MSHREPKTYWRGPAERDGQDAASLDSTSSSGDSPALNRRRFLEAAGFAVSLAAVGGCRRAPVETALPFARQPAGLIPGRMQSYASTCNGCGAGCGLLVGVRDGRPLKMEGMPEHPLSKGGLCAIGQAQPLELYDHQRLSGPLVDGKDSDWDAIDRDVMAQLSKAQGAVVLVTATVTSPTLQAAIDAFLSSVDNGRHVVFDADSASAILDAHEATHGARVLPRFRFDKAQVVVSLGADFLGTWISPVEYTAAWCANRAPLPGDAEMSYHVQLEGRMSLTGCNADRRHRVRPEEYAAILSQLASQIGQLAEKPLRGVQTATGDFTSSDSSASNTAPLADEDLKDLVDKLWHARGKSLVVCSSQDVAVQRLVNYVNHVLGNYGQTLDIQRPSRQRQGNDVDVVQLMGELKAGDVAALLVAGTDLTHNLPDREALTKAVGETPLVVSFASRLDDFASQADFVCPDHHPLESWMDAEPVSGVVSISQPMLQPLRNTRSLLETLHRWAGVQKTAYELIQESWRERILPRSPKQQPFQAFWDQAVHDGFVELASGEGTPGAFQFDQVAVPPQPAPANAFSLTLYSKVGLTDSRHAHNPWLQELPDPVTKVAWDNYVGVSETTAEKHELSEGDVVRLTASDNVEIELPVHVQPGQHDDVLSVALGYGVKGTDRFADIGPEWLESRPTVAAGERVGKNAARFVQFRGGAMRLERSGVELTKVGGRRELACTQQHHTLTVPRNVAPHGAEVRDVVQETTLPVFAKNPRAGEPQVHHHGDKQLWPDDHPKDHHHWGMVVDLNCCTGCSACLIACQSENNVPVVGKDEVRRGREMHWLRIDRYYSGEDNDIDVAHQPMMCQHCDNAPCETVCPVLATIHGEEGLNEQAYNRCVGTRYCANNCPYKVRRFNWFTYEHDDDMENLALNPDVTIRTRGVMEKCSMCVQRIEDGKLEAKRLGQPLADGAIQTACQQSCPAQAIFFGDMHDPQSDVSKALENPRRYGVLEEFNFRPSVSYLRVVANRDDRGGEQNLAEGGHHE